jgi:hypothetical protein
MTRALVLLLLLCSGCDSAYTPTARPAIYVQAQWTADVSAKQTDDAMRVTATFQRQALNATQTQLALEARAQGGVGGA